MDAFAQRRNGVLDNKVFNLAGRDKAGYLVIVIILLILVYSFLARGLGKLITVPLGLVGILLSVNLYNLAANRI